VDHGDVGDFTSPLTLDEQGVPSLVNPEKYRLSGINPGVNPGHLGLKLLIALQRPNGPILLNG